MKTTRVYDYPTRILHWLFAGTFIGSYFIATFLDEESALYPYHMILGLVLVLVVLLRVLWGFVGSRYARFSALPLSPTALIQYFKDIFTAKTERKPGHNPASGWAALAMMALALGLGVTGYMMTQGGSNEFYEDAHELMAHAFIIVVIAHVAGIILHTLRHRDSIGLSMIHGNKQNFASTAGITKSYASVGLIFAAIIGVFVFHLNKNYDPNTQNLTLFGATLQLGESEHEGLGDDD